MTKRRLTAIVLSSPLLVAMFLAVLLVACIMYAISGKWELMAILKDDFGFTLKSKEA